MKDVKEFKKSDVLSIKREQLESHSGNWISAKEFIPETPHTIIDFLCIAEKEINSILKFVKSGKVRYKEVCWFNDMNKQWYRKEDNSVIRDVIFWMVIPKDPQ